MSRVTLTTAALVAVLASSVTTDAQVTINKCQAGKEQCVGKTVGCLLKCHAKAETTGTLDSTCLLKCRRKFDGNQLVPPNPAKGCIQKLQAKGGCSTADETVAMVAKVDAFVNDVVCQFDPSEGTCPCDPISQNCPAGQGCYLASSSTAICETPTGSGTQGATCSAMTDCARGFACVDSGPGLMCFKFCDVSSPSCLSGTCASINWAANPNVGACR